MTCFHRLLALSALCAALIPGCNTKSHVPTDGGGDAGADASSDAGGGEPCGPATCASGQVCCNASCGICTAPGEGCIEIACVDGGPSDAGVVDGGGGEPCGPTTCGAGEVCCNASCGICTAPDGSCPAIACVDGGMPPLCAPMDARGQGACRLFLGYVWDGSSCVGIGGCECVGGDCADLYGELSACEADHRDCFGPPPPPPPGAVCGGFSGASCPPSHYCDFPDGAFCGAADATGVCISRPEGCTFEYDPVCGCDGMTYGNACIAAMSGVDYATRGECGTSTDPSPGS